MFLAIKIPPPILIILPHLVIPPPEIRPTPHLVDFLVAPPHEILPPVEIDGAAPPRVVQRTAWREPPRDADHGRGGDVDGFDPVYEHARVAEGWEDTLCHARFASFE